MGSRVYGSTQDHRQGLKGLRHDIRVKHTPKNRYCQRQLHVSSPNPPLHWQLAWGAGIRVS